MAYTSPGHIRREIAQFIANYENPDLPIEKIEEIAHELYDSSSIESWLLDALKRVDSSNTGRNPIRLTTHTVKPMHPSIDKAENLLVTRYARRENESSVASHSIESIADFNLDVTGNAAHGLKRFKFGSLVIDGKFLIELVRDRDHRLSEALKLDAQECEKFFGSLDELSSPLSRTHTKAKQLYWLIGDEPAADEDFHLLAPLYATSLAHRIFQTINHDRFSDDAKAARDARKKGHSSDHGYCDYPTLAVQRFGGSKPQNISQLNSERGGNSYLLSAAPPVWRSRAVSPIYTSSAFGAYGRRVLVGAALRGLGDFLATDPRRNMHTRDYRDQLTCELVDELIVFTTEMHQLPAGWTADWHCRLPFEQQCWLDPHRAHQDSEFAERLVVTDWLATVCADFSRWLTGRLERYWKISMGDPEHRHFSREAARDDTVKAVFETEYANWHAKLETELAGLKEVLDNDDE